MSIFTWCPAFSLPPLCLRAHPTCDVLGSAPALKHAHYTLRCPFKLHISWHLTLWELNILVIRGCLTFQWKTGWLAGNIFFYFPVIHVCLGIHIIQLFRYFLIIFFIVHRQYSLELVNTKLGIKAWLVWWTCCAWLSLCHPLVYLALTWLVLFIDCGLWSVTDVWAFQCPAAVH